MSASDDTDVTPFLTEEARRIMGELAERLRADLEQPDVDAIETALWKALLAGTRRGFATAMFQIRQTCGDVPAELQITDGDSDEWAKRYGDNADA
jgi:hypothetical protein